MSRNKDVIEKDEDTKKGGRLKVLARKTEKLPASLCRSIWKIGQDDPRRVLHSLKMGLALTLVSLLYVLEPLFEGVGQNAIWAVMTVVVVLEFSVGATLCKGLNRGFGTLCAGSLVFFIESVAEESGPICRAVFVGTSVFLIGFMATYLRFFPKVKRNYDYGVVIFLLTFNLITVSSYRIQNILQVALQRLYTIGIGCGICLVMSLFIFPNWSGEDLRNSTVNRFEVLARSIEASVNDYFRDKEIEVTEEDSSEDPIYKSYMAVLDSKSSDEALALFASWEPRHSRRWIRYPWEQYVKLGGVLRHFGYSAIALHGCLESEIQTPKSIRCLFREPSIRVAREVSKVLTELACSIKNQQCCSHDMLSDGLSEALQELNSAIQSQSMLFLGSNHANYTPKLQTDGKIEKDVSSTVAVASVENDGSASLDRRIKRAAVDQPKESLLKETPRPTLSKIATIGHEFSEALPFAAFSSLLVEMAARLDLVIKEVEILGKSAEFKDFSVNYDVKIKVDCENKAHKIARDLQSHVVAPTTME